MPTTQTTHPPGGSTVDLDSIPSGVWGGLGAGSMLSLLYWLLATGRLIQARVVDQMMSDKDSQIDKLWSANGSLTESVRMYAISAETSAHALHEVEKRAASAGDDK